MSSDIYGVDQNKPVGVPMSSRRRRSTKLGTEQDISKTHVRRSKNTGFRRLVHLMKKPEFSRKFWISVLSVIGLILAILILWDTFFRYSSKEDEVSLPRTRQVQLV